MTSSQPGASPCSSTRQLSRDNMHQRATMRPPGAPRGTQCIQNFSSSRCGVISAPRRAQQRHLPWVQCAADTAGADEGSSFSSGAASSLAGGSTTDGLFVAASQPESSPDRVRNGNSAAAQHSTAGGQADSHSAASTGLRTSQRADADDRAAEAPSDHAADSWLRSHYDGEIFRLAIPALAAVMLDPLMGYLSSLISHLMGVQCIFPSLRVLLHAQAGNDMNTAHRHVRRNGHNGDGVRVLTHGHVGCNHYAKLQHCPG